MAKGRWRKATNTPTRRVRRFSANGFHTKEKEQGGVEKTRLTGNAITHFAHSLPYDEYEEIFLGNIAIQPCTTRGTTHISLMAFFWYHSKVNTSTEMHFKFKWMKALCLKVNCSSSCTQVLVAVLVQQKSFRNSFVAHFRGAGALKCTYHTQKRRQFCHHHAVHFRRLYCMVG